MSTQPHETDSRAQDVPSFEKQSPPMQQFVLRGISQQILALAYPKLRQVTEMYREAGLIVKTKTEEKATGETVKARALLSIAKIIASDTESNHKVQQIQKILTNNSI